MVRKSCEKGHKQCAFFMQTIARYIYHIFAFSIKLFDEIMPKIMLKPRNF